MMLLLIGIIDPKYNNIKGIKGIIFKIMDQILLLINRDIKKMITGININSFANGIE